MEIHYSTYEKKEGWIPLTKEYPKPDVKVRVCNIHLMDWNLEQMEWEATGWVKPDGCGNSKKRLWSLKLDGFKSYNLKIKSLQDLNPTHWKEYKYENII